VTDPGPDRSGPHSGLWGSSRKKDGAASRIADGRGLAAALALGSDGVLLGTRFFASQESPVHWNFKQAITDSDGHDTLLTEIPDRAAGIVWPGAMLRARRNAFIGHWAGRE